MESKFAGLIDPNSTVLIDLIGKDANENIATQLQMGKSGLIMLVKVRLQEFLYKGGWGLQEHSAGLRFSPLLFSEIQRVSWEVSVSNACYTLVMNLSPINYKESLLADNSFFWLTVNIEIYLDKSYKVCT